MKSYQFLPEYHNAIASLTDEQYGRIMRAVNEYVFSGEEPQLDGVEYAIWCLAFNRLKISRSRSHSNAGAPIGNRNNPLGRGARTNQELIKNQSKTNQEPIKNQSNVADTQSVTRVIGSELVNSGVKETENKEEDTPSPSNLPQTLSFTSTPIEEEKKDKEKKEMQKKVDIDEEKEISFYEQMKEHYPRVMSMRQPLTWKQYLKMTTEDGFSARLIKSILEEMENYAMLSQRYVSANLTIRNWIRNKRK